MKDKGINLLTHLALIMACFATFAVPGLSQRALVKTDSRILYHGGPVMAGTSAVFLIWYGNWPQGFPGGGGSDTQSILTDLVVNLGSSPYFLINSMYPDSSGAAPSGALIYGGHRYDGFSRGTSLSASDIRAVITSQLASGGFMLDPNGIYIVIGSADVTDVHPNSDGTYTTFCNQGARPHHGYFTFSGTDVKYAYIGDYSRCPSVAPVLVPTPNGNLAADGMASTMARVLNMIVTSPLGADDTYGGWYDRYGLENADKCARRFGTPYTTPNGAQANVRLGQRDFLLQQNWVNVRKGYCGLLYP